MNELNKTIVNGFGSLATLVVAALVWENVALTVLFLAIVTAVMLYVEKSRSAVVIYVVAFILGPLSEAWLIHAGAWSYAQPQFLGFPYWLPFIWGNAALMFNRINIYLNYVVRKQGCSIYRAALSVVHQTT